CANELGGAAELAASHRLYAFTVLEDPRWSVWDAVESAREHARAALRVAHWSDATPAINEMNMFVNQPPEVLAQHASAERALKSLGAEQPREAIKVLWSAYQGNRSRPLPNAMPAAQVFAQLNPGGTGFYAFIVARSMRASVIAWYNAANPTSYYE